MEPVEEELPIRTLPSIDAAKAKHLKNIDTTQRVIIQEKIDGSQFTICRKGNEVHYYNKHKKKDPRGSTFRNSWLYLQGKTHFLKEHYSYHGEALRTRQSNTVAYERCPFWVIYEIVRPDNTILTPEEMDELLKDTPFETVQILYDNGGTGAVENKADIDLAAITTKLMAQIEAGEIKSSLGGTPEGFVLKVLNAPHKDRTKISRFKFVRKAFKEANSSKRERLPEVSDEEFIQALGDVYNCEPRFQKAVQHLQEDDRWGTDMDKNIHPMVDELDNDLLKQDIDEIKTQLFIRFFPQISKAARVGLREFLNARK